MTYHNSVARRDIRIAKDPIRISIVESPGLAFVRENHVLYVIIILLLLPYIDAKLLMLPLMAFITIVVASVCVVGPERAMLAIGIDIGYGSETETEEHTLAEVIEVQKVLGRHVKPHVNHKVASKDAAMPMDLSEEDIKRTTPPQTLLEFWTEWSKAHSPHKNIPSPTPGSPAASPNFDKGYIYLSPTITHQGQDMPNPYGWAETAASNVFVSSLCPGHWLIKTDNEDYLRFNWMMGNSIWYCYDLGVGISLEDNGEVKVMHDLDPKNMMGPQIYGTQGNMAGPYWEEAVSDSRKIWNQTMQASFEEDEFEKLRRYRQQMKVHNATRLRDEKDYVEYSRQFDKRYEEQPFRKT